MFSLTREFVRDRVADSPIIYQRGVGIYEHGAFILRESDPENGRFRHEVVQCHSTVYLACVFEPCDVL